MGGGGRLSSATAWRGDTGEESLEDMSIMLCQSSVRARAKISEYADDPMTNNGDILQRIDSGRILSRKSRVVQWKVKGRGRQRSEGVTKRTEGVGSGGCCALPSEFKCSLLFHTDRYDERCSAERRMDDGCMN